MKYSILFILAIFVSVTSSQTANISPQLEYLTEVQQQSTVHHELQAGKPPPTKKPTRRPTRKPTRQSSARPSMKPSSLPTYRPTVAKVTRLLTPIRLSLSPKDASTPINYDQVQNKLENHLAAYFFSDPEFAGTFLSVTLTRRVRVRSRSVLTLVHPNPIKNNYHRLLADTEVVYDGSVTFTQQGAPSEQTLQSKQNDALYSGQWGASLQSSFNQINLNVKPVSATTNKESSSIGMIVGIVIAVVVAIGIVAITLVFLRKPKNKTTVSPKSRSVEVYPPPPPPPPPRDETTYDDDDDDDDDIEEVDEEDKSHGWRKYGISSKHGAVTNMKTGASQTSTDRRGGLNQSQIDEYSLNGDDYVETSAGEELLNRVLAMGSCPENDQESNPEGAPGKAESETQPDLSLFQLRDGIFSGTVNYLQHLMSFETDDSHRITVITGSATTPNESENSRDIGTVPATVMEEDEELDVDNEEEIYDQTKDSYGVLSPLSDSTYSSTRKNPSVPPEALRERVRSAIADSSSPTTQERHNAMYQANAANALSDDAVSVTRLASDSRKTRLSATTPKEITIKSGDAAELRKMRLQGNNADAPKKVGKGAMASKNLRKARLAKEHSSARVTKQSARDLYAV